PPCAASTRSLHDALPIWAPDPGRGPPVRGPHTGGRRGEPPPSPAGDDGGSRRRSAGRRGRRRGSADGTSQRRGSSGTAGSAVTGDRKSTRLNSSHVKISY